MISSLYISDDDKSDDDDDDGMLNVGGVQNMQTDIEQIKVDLLALSSQVQSLKQDFQQSIDCAINRENSFREAVDASFAGMEEYCQKSLEKLEKAVIDCFLRRDAKWESQWKELRPTSTPTIARLQAYTPATSYLSSVHLPKNPVASRANVIPPNNTYAISSVSAPQLAGVTTAPYAAGSSSFCARPLIRLEFPSFDGAGDTADVLNFIEQCENFLDLRPLSSIELLGTLSSVLSGPALSWWKAERIKVTDWKSFKEAFMDAFLPDEYLRKWKTNWGPSYNSHDNAWETSLMTIELSVSSGSLRSQRKSW